MTVRTGQDREEGTRFSGAMPRGSRSWDLSESVEIQGIKSHRWRVGGSWGDCGEDPLAYFWLLLPEMFVAATTSVDFWVVRGACEASPRMVAMSAISTRVRAVASSLSTLVDNTSDDLSNESRSDSFRTVRQS